MNGKQGGYYYDWCANVTIDPNPDGCDQSKIGLEAIKEELVSSGMQVVTHHATDAEHEAAKAGLLEHDDTLRVVHTGTQTDTSTAPNPRKDRNPEIEPRSELSERDELTCFDGSVIDICYGVSRALAFKAADWFCRNHDGMEIDNISTDGPLSFAAN